MKRRMRASLVAVLAAMAGGHALHAQEILYQPAVDSPIETRNPAGPAGLAQLDFLAGDWDVVVTMPQGDEPPLVFKAKWHNHWVANGYVMMQEWRGPYATGLEFRSFNAATGKWDGRNLYVPQPGTWYENQAEKVGDEMVVTTHKVAPDGTPFLNREIYHGIGEGRFAIRTEVSLDDGASWHPGRYSLVAVRGAG